MRTSAIAGALAEERHLKSLVDALPGDAFAKLARAIDSPSEEEADQVLLDAAEEAGLDGEMLRASASAVHYLRGAVWARAAREGWRAREHGHGA